MENTKKHFVSNKVLITLFTVFLLLLIVIAFKLSEEPITPQPIVLEKVTIATTFSSIVSYSIFVAQNKGFFKHEGLDVSLLNLSHGTANLNAILQGKADIAASSETPFLRSVVAKNDLSIIATTFTAEHHLALVARKDHGINSFQDLRGKTIAVTMGSNGEYFLDILLSMNGMIADQVTRKHVKPLKIVQAITSGSVDAIVTWAPTHQEAQNILGDNSQVFYADEIYSPSFIVVATQNYIQDNPIILKKFLMALDKASKFILSSPAEARKIVSKQSKIDISLLEDLSSSLIFKLTLSQFLLTILNNQAEWEIKRAGNSLENVPNFLDHIHFETLDSINPDAISIIR